MKPTVRDVASTLFTPSAKKMARAFDLDAPISIKKVLRRHGAKVAVDAAAFAKAIEETCRGRCIGFGFAIFEGDAKKPSAAGGHGRAVIADGTVGQVDFTEKTRLNIHSMSKTLCAAVIVRALHVSKGRFTLESPIGPLLRPHWELAANVPDITLKQLLVHDSGLRDVNESGQPAEDASIPDKESMKGVKSSLKNGIVAAKGSRGYENGPFSLCRMLLPFIDSDGDPDFSKARLHAMSEDEFNKRTQSFYIRYVHRHFFDPLELSRDIRPRPNGPSPFTRYYRFHDPADFDVDPTDATNEEFCGASAWFMSALEYAQLIKGLRFRKVFGLPGEEWSPWETICDRDHRTEPGEDGPFRLGVQELNVGLGRVLVALAKAGGGGNRFGPSNAWMGFGNLTAVLLINSMGGEIEHAFPALNEAVGALFTLHLAGKAAFRQ